MKQTLEQVAGEISAQKLELAARNLQHLLKIQEEQASLENVVASIQQTVIDAHANNPVDLCDMMTLQACTLDALFHYYLTESKGKYGTDLQIDKALKAQQQTVRTMMAWKKLKTDTYVKNKVIKFLCAEKNPEGTE